MRIDPNTGLNDAEFLSHNTVRIEGESTDGDIAIGTGFLYLFESTNKTPVPALVTNKHVIEDVQTVTIVFNPTGENNKIDFKAEKLAIKMTEFSNFWFRHPDPDIDLALIPVAFITDRLAGEKKYPFTVFFRKENFPKQEEWNTLTALEEVVIVGYPSGIWDPVNNLPILRKGVTATHPKINYRGRPEFVIDAAVYPGSSGSPVFLYEYKDVMLGQDLNLGKDKPRLAGILSAVYTYQQDGEMKSIPIPTRRKQIPVMKIPNNLGIVIKSTELDGFIPLLDKKLAEQESKK